ncbi:MAG TPA: serine/threonine-protein kinase, partial [Thermoanaerobaculia bacterium]|nr:serine/threonine-protein kinase [Thermoanaerobaculia bacterium]
ILALLTGAGLVGLRSREGILRFVDVKFFAEQHASWEFLGQLAKEFRLSSTTAELARDIANGIDRALHLETVAVLVHSRKTGRLVDPAEQCQPFDPTSELGKLASANHAPLETDLTDPNTPLKSLPEEDRYWIADNRFRLLVPLSSMDGSLLGLIGLGERRSGSPFLAEDLKLLDTLADSAAIKLELLLMHENELPDQRPPTLPANPDEHLRPARECVRCGTALSPEALSCGRCDRPTELQEARVPYILPGRLRFQRRIGSGGMGIVYLAMDLKLGTTRAVKTLRRVSPEDSVRLQAEARIAAAVTHPNLATVYGIESWRGTPMLILEHLPNGTLLQRLSRKPLGLSETLRLGLAITGAVERLHDHGILHRDIKPSNIGFAQDETPKLMDFGIARVQVDPRRDGGSDRRSLPADAAATPTILWTRRGPSRASQKLIGTVSYLPPEAFRKGFEADPSTDLWALCLVLYECLTGEQVFTGDEIGKIIQDIRKGVPPLEEIWREAELPLCQFFERNLASDRARRAPTASALMRELQRLSSSLQADDRQAVN